jgi:hypothetical protein
VVTEALKEPVTSIFKAADECRRFLETIGDITLRTDQRLFLVIDCPYLSQFLLILDLRLVAPIGDYEQRYLLEYNVV